MLRQIDVSLLTGLPKPTMPAQGGQEGLFMIIGAIMLPGAVWVLFLVCFATAGTTTIKRWAIGVTALALGVGAVFALRAGATLANDRNDEHAAAMRTHEAAVAERDRETARAEKTVLTAVKEQYRVREARPTDTDRWGWKTARAALTESSTDSPTIEVLTEDDQREHVQVEYDNATGEATLIADGTRSEEANLDVASLRRTEASHD